MWSHDDIRPEMSAEQSESLVGRGYIVTDHGPTMAKFSSMSQAATKLRVCEGWKRCERELFGEDVIVTLWVRCDVELLAEPGALCQTDDICTWFMDSVGANDVVLFTPGQSMETFEEALKGAVVLFYLLILSEV